jgi:hypothetical protein
VDIAVVDRDEDITIAGTGRCRYFSSEVNVRDEMSGSDLGPYGVVERLGERSRRFGREGIGVVVRIYRNGGGSAIVGWCG